MIRNINRNRNRFTTQAIKDAETETDSQRKQLSRAALLNFSLSPAFRAVSFCLCFPDLLCFKNSTETETGTDSQRKQLKMDKKEDLRNRNRNRNRFTTQAIKTLQEKLCGLLIHTASDLRWPSLIACVVNLFLFLFLHL